MRKVRDAFGEMEVSEDVYYGAQTQRSLENFPIGTETMPKRLIEAFVMLKRAAAKANHTLSVLPKETSDRIVTASDQWLHQPEYKHFPLVVWQTGSGTQTNMNVNEVLSFLASDESVSLHPNDDLNRSQSSNDTFPTAMHVATAIAVTDHLFPALHRLIQTVKEKQTAFQAVVKIGRTHLQDATPLTVGQELSGYLAMLEKTEHMLLQDMDECFELAIGGTAVGTGLNAPDGFGEEVVHELSRYTGLPFRKTDNHFHGLTSHDQLVRFHGTIKALAMDLFKMGNDLRYLASGPRAGYGEYTLPANEPGSSIMPGKVNPTQIEALTMVCSQVLGNDTTISFAASQGQFQLNVFKPVIIYNVLQSIELLSEAMDSFNLRCLSGLKINEDIMADKVDQSLMLVTALNPHIGYDKASNIAKYAHQHGTGLKTAAITLGYVTAEQFDQWVKPSQMI
ncbi:fumarate hydratase, class II [Halolactibacillus halophilus]|uniref:Fumarate hydratase class II n=1 Tax=Halolactibacillus halophilus TaxID=306540 RepID=A0A1I5MUF2_9BACI|nr:class II fumarate hydratase [Halolactibacillus halophilus]GEM01257.1 fumarate hydratase class II [Halolactibacillus halophilus]SFP12651.1 fumarate hydratase, class II [Halolactibacillus halophilus]